jgi:hypothetical protein
MSTLGQKRTLGYAGAISALPPTAAIRLGCCGFALNPLSPVILTNGSVTSRPASWQLTLKRYPMIAMVMGFAILAAFALGLVIGRVWQIRSDELQRRAGFTLPTIARIPRRIDVKS